MTCPPLRAAPPFFVCVDCKATVWPKRHRPGRERCGKCAQKRSRRETARKTRLGLPKRPYSGPSDCHELGPVRPLLGMTATEYLAWRDRRIVELWESEEELSVAALAERFDMQPDRVTAVLNRAGHHLLGKGRGSGRGYLPAGLPIS